MARHEVGSGTMLIAHCADQHFGSGKGLFSMGGEFSYLDRTVSACDRLVESFRSKGVDGVISAGDLWHTKNPTPEEIGAVIRFLLELDTLGVPCIIIPGNHDQQNPTTTVLDHLRPLQGKLSNVILVNDPKVYDLWGLKVAVVPGHRNECVSDLVGEDPDILVIHADVKGGAYDNGVKSYRGLDLSPYSSIPYIALGDFHSRQRINNAAYPGSAYQTKFGEKSLKRGYLLVKWTKSGPKAKPVNIPQDYPLITIEVETQDQLNSRLAEIPPSYTVKVKVKQGVTIDLGEDKRVTKVETTAVKTDIEIQSATVEDPLSGIEDILKQGGYDLSEEKTQVVKDEARKIVTAVDG